jgi:hypothetical protein
MGWIEEEMDWKDGKLRRDWVRGEWEGIEWMGKVGKEERSCGEVMME